MKVCTGCGERKDLSEYYKRSAPRTDTQQPCKECYRAAAKDRRAANPGYMRDWSKNRRDSRTPEQQAAHREYMLQWQRSNRDKVARYHHERRALEQGAGYERFSVEDVPFTDCGECGQPIDRALRWPDPQSMSLDHIVPLSRGGSHSRDNVRWVHLVCNLRKGAHMPTIEKVLSE